MRSERFALRNPRGGEIVVTTLDERDWTSVFAICARLPLSDALSALRQLLPDQWILDVWLWDHQRRVLTRVGDGRSLSRSDLRVDMERRQWKEVRLQGDDLGIAVLDAPGESVPGTTLDRLANALAGAVRASEATTDTVSARQRTEAMSLPAEMQWQLLPPSQFRMPGFTLSAAVEPAYDTGGDVYDYSLDGRSLFLAVVDARGHGLQAATTATVASGAMRRARRNGQDLRAIADEVARALGAIGAEHDFVSAVMVQLDMDSGQGEWLSAGHLPPLVIDDTGVSELQLTPALPLGLVLNGNGSEPVIRSFTLEPGQSIVLYSDGIVENAAADSGLAVGEQRFQDALGERLRQNVGREHTAPGHVARDHVARDIVEDLLAITGPDLRDDATLLVVSRLETAPADFGWLTSRDVL